MSPNAEGAVPKIVWTFWLQGWDAAPEIVRRCLQSWQRLNPDWDIRALDGRSVDRYVNLAKALGPNLSSASPQAVSDIVRMNLLAEYGGVWTDASVFCCRPLDSWIWEKIGAGFFVFTNPGPDRLISSWFVVSSIANPLTTAVRDGVNGYWSQRRFRNRPRLEKRLGKILGRSSRTARLWLSAPIRDGLKLHPYFWLHYLFAQTVRSEPQAAAVWARAGKLDASGPSRLQYFGMSTPPDREMRREIDEVLEPLYKLDARGGAAAIGTGGALDYLLERWETP